MSEVKAMPRIKTSEPPQAAGSDMMGVSLPRTPRIPEGQEIRPTLGSTGTGRVDEQPQTLELPDSYRAQGRRKSVKWERSIQTSPRGLLPAGSPHRSPVKGGFFSKYDPPSNYDLTSKRSQEVPAPWDYAEAQMKPIPPAGTAMFSRSTENYQHDKWYRRTVFNAPETVDSTALYPGPGAYDPMFKVHSKFKRSYNATICPGDKMARESLPAIDKHLRRSLVHEFLPIVGRDVRPFEGMTVTISRTQMHKWNMHEDAYHKTRGTIFEVAEDELTCMVVWDMPYPGPEEEYSLCNTGKEGKYWLAVPKPRPTTPIARRWVLDAIVSPRYEFDPGQGTFSIPSKKKVTQVQQERRKGVRNVVERGSIIAEVKKMVLLEAKLRDIEAEKQKRKQELLERMHIEMERQRQMRAISLRTVADHREVDSDPLKNLFHMSGFERVPSEEETSRQIYEKLLSEQTDALDSQLKQDRKSQPRKAPSVKQHNDAPKLEPLSDETIEFLRSLFGIQRLFGRLVEIRQRIKAKAAKQIATEKEQSRVSSCSLSGIVRNRLMPAIDMSIYNKRREIRKEIRLKSRSVLVKDHHASTIYHHTPKRFHRPSGHLLQTLERLSQPRTEHQDTTLHNRDLKNTTLNRDLKDTALHNGDLKNKTKRSGKMQQAMRIWSPGDQKLHHDTEMVVLGEDEYLSAEFDEDVEDDEQKMFEVPAADTTGKEDGCRIQRQDLGICEDGGYVDQKSGDKPDGVVDGEQNNVKEGDGLSNVKEGDGLRLDESVEGDGTDCNQEALDEGGGCKTDANAEVGTKRNTGTAADVGKEVAIEHGGEEIAPGDDSAQDHSEEPQDHSEEPLDDSAQDHSEEPQDHSEEPLDDSTQDHSEEPLVTMHDGQGEERNETVACTTPRRKSQLLEEMSALRENRVGNLEVDEHDKEIAPDAAVNPSGTPPRTPDSYTLRRTETPASSGKTPAGTSPEGNTVEAAEQVPGGGGEGPSEGDG